MRYLLKLGDEEITANNHVIITRKIRRHLRRGLLKGNDVITITNIQEKKETAVIPKKPAPAKKQRKGKVVDVKVTLEEVKEAVADKKETE